MSISTRRQEVVALADEVGHHSARARQVAAYATRPDKNTSTDPEDLRASWKRTLDAVGLTEKAVEEMAAGRPVELWRPHDGSELFTHLGSSRGGDGAEGDLRSA